MVIHDHSMLDCFLISDSINKSRNQNSMLSLIIKKQSENHSLSLEEHSLNNYLSLQSYYRFSEKEIHMAQPLFEIRNTIKSSLTLLVSKCDKDAKLEYLIKITQALVLTNKAIWKRCQCYLDQDKVACYNKKELPFKCFGFNKVIVETTPEKSPCWLTFSTRCIFDFQSFFIMPLPKELSNVILPHDKEGIALTSKCFSVRRNNIDSFSCNHKGSSGKATS